ncbi:hypothetical protein [Aequorivita marina]|uniref:hypothetical protein n=1 Tax=Aequorivita marina TaxID=3073654 RepID=UPI0028743215|nr:hypothetical protein [Aequorivita sp. S2608]MDS1298285.1 hypothetical protein [Aequorivita sp. S2608]
MAFSILRPVPKIHEDEAIIEKGVVVAIYDDGGSDIVFKLQGNDRRFYINRGLQTGLKLEGLKKKLIGKEVTLKYPKYWTPLDWNNKTKHISKIEFKKEVLFNELK